MQIAVVGLPWSGKTTLFNTLASYAGMQPRGQAGVVSRCVVPIPDPRVSRLVDLFNPRKTTRATVEYIDVPGLDVRGGAGHGVPGVILTQIKNAAALVEVIGGFAEDQPTEPAERVAAWCSDSEALETEMLIGDLTIVEGRRERLVKLMKKVGGEQFQAEFDLLGRCEEALSDGIPLRRLDLEPDEVLILSGFQLLTHKPILRLVNVDEAALAEAEQWITLHWPESAGVSPLEFSAAIESEIATLAVDEQAEFLAELGVREPVLPRLLAASQQLLGLITFFTVGEQEVHAWPIRRGTRAQQAAGEIHSDLERGFIRAEVVAYDDLDVTETMAGCRELGTLRLEGREYVVQDADVMTIRFSV